MKRLLTILLLVAGTACGQIDNPPTSVNIVDSTATGRAVLTATNAAAARTAIGLSLPALTNTNVVNFRTDIGLVGSGFASFNSGSSGNDASGEYASTVGGALNTASGNYSFAAGRNAKATNQGAFVWADSQTGNFSSLSSNTFNVRASGGMSLDLGTNGISFRNPEAAAATRTNLGLGATWLTNTNATNFRSDIGLGNIRTNSIDTRNGNAVGGFTGGNGGYIDLRGGDGNTNAGGNISLIGSGGAAGSINLSGSTNSGNGGSIDLSGGGFGNYGGSINLRGSRMIDLDVSSGYGGSINLSGGNPDGSPGGSIFASGGSAEGAPGGTLDMRGSVLGSSGGASGGSIYTYGSNSLGGTINTSDGGGSINTRGTGSIGLGVSGTRTTLTGTATEDRAISLPNASGTIALTNTLGSWAITTDASTARTNLGLGATWLTNTNVTNFRSAIGLGTTNAVGFRSVEVSDGLNAGIMRFPNITSGIQFLVGGTTKVSFTPTNAEFATNVSIAGSLTIASPTVPTATNSTGVKGQIAFTNNFLYICISNNTWRRVQLGTW
jgi:hypothetical protein